jgi:hypothetical protein
LNDGPDAFTGLFFGLIIGEGKENVDIGEGEEVLASISSESQQGNIGRGLSRERPTPHFNEETVDYGGSAANRCRAIAGALTGLPDERHLAQILIPKIVNRQSDWIHVKCDWFGEA